jgi:hypothetical protein
MHRAHTLARTAALSIGEQRLDPLEIARGMIVLGCAFALIMAGPIFPV